jgi:hypothetical protein
MQASKYPSPCPDASNLVPTSAPAVPAGAVASVTSSRLSRVVLTRCTLRRAEGGSSSSPSTTAEFSIPRTCGVDNSRSCSQVGGGGGGECSNFDYTP